MQDLPSNQQQTPGHGKLWRIGQIIWYTLFISGMLGIVIICLWGAFFFE